jgi:flagellar export protein FliJ
MRFHFQLEGLLRVRRLLERQARERLDESMMRLRSLEQSLAEAAEWRQKTKAITSKTTLPAAELHFVESVLHQTQQAIRRGQQQKCLEEEQAAKLRAHYLDARRKHETVGTLRENAFRQFQTEQSRREQSALDEAFLGKLIHSRNHPQRAPDAKPETNR